MSVDVTGKHWLLQNERVLLSLAAHPERTVSSIAAVFAVKREELQAWLDKYNGGESELTVARIHAVKTELGLLTVERAGTPAPKREAVEPAAPVETKRTWAGMRAEQSKARKETPPPPAKLTERDDGMSPWAKRPNGPREGTLKKYRKHLDKLADGGRVDDNAPAWLFFVTAWLGSKFPAATRVKRFLAWADIRNGQELPVPAERRNPEVPVPAVLVSAPPKPVQEESVVEPDRPREPESIPGLAGWLELRGDRFVGADDAWYNGKAHNPILLFRRQTTERLHKIGIKRGVPIGLFWNPDKRLLALTRKADGTVQLQAERALLCVKRKDLVRLFGTKKLKFQILEHRIEELPALDLVLEVKGAGA